MNMVDQGAVLFPDVLRNNARFYRNHVAVRLDDEYLSWADFHVRTNRVANALLTAGLQHGDRVAMITSTSIPSFELIWGIVKAGGVVAPLNAMVAPEAVPAMLANASPAFIFVDDATIERFGEIVADAASATCQAFSLGQANGAIVAAGPVFEAASDVDPDVWSDETDSLSILYSSGTTGVPKGIEHTHRARMSYAFSFGPTLKFDRYAVTLCSTPLYTNGTWITMLPTVFYGGTVVLMKKFDPAEFVATVERWGITHSFLVPTQIIGMLGTEEIANADLSSLRVVMSGGAPLATKTYEEFRSRVPATGLYECWGISEGFMTMALPNERRSVGKPIFGGDVRVIDGDGVELTDPNATGELVGWSAMMMKGYYQDPDRTSEAIWTGPQGRTYLRSGDVGHLDDDGFVHVSGRVKDMIISGGINIYAADIEDVFMAHPDVIEAAAVGIPHEKWGETPLLFVIAREGASESELMAWGNQKLGKFQRVSGVEFRPEFPRAAHDKILKRVLREEHLKR